MMNPNKIAKIASLIGDPARARILLTLMGGQSLTAKELARSANITPQTASSHLSKLVSASLLTVNQQGRHRYHRIASTEVANLIENLMQLGSKNTEHPAHIVTGPRNPAMRMARTCYDHFAGNLGVAITDSLVSMRFVEFNEEARFISAEGIDYLERFGILLKPDPYRKKKAKRPLCRPCLDWSLRRPHVAGVLGAAICTHFFDQKFVIRIEQSRAVRILPKGKLALSEIFGIASLADDSDLGGITNGLAHSK